MTRKAPSAGGVHLAGNRVSLQATIQSAPKELATFEAAHEGLGVPVGITDGLQAVAAEDRGEGVLYVGEKPSLLDGALHQQVADVSSPQGAVAVGHQGRGDPMGDEELRVGV